MNLNARAAALCETLIRDAAALRVAVTQLDSGARIIDCGIKALGGLEAGVMLARICMADLATIEVASDAGDPWPPVAVSTDQPVLACMASQYAGWELKHEKFFAMGSGPMRAAAAREPLFADLGYRETAEACVGVLETAKQPPAALCDEIAAKCGVPADKLTLLVAPTRSPAGLIQIVARSVETALHKLHELKFDLRRIERGAGTAPAPLSNTVTDDFAAIGLTNDAILYGGCVTLEVRGDDASLEQIGPQVPSSASRDYGRPFAETMAAYGNDFYRIDPLLFSPAEIAFVNLDTGRTFRFGRVNQELLRESFGSGE